MKSVMDHHKESRDIEVVVNQILLPAVMVRCAKPVRSLMRTPGHEKKHHWSRVVPGTRCHQISGWQGVALAVHGSAADLPTSIASPGSLMPKFTVGNRRSTHRWGSM